MHTAPMPARAHGTARPTNGTRVVTAAPDWPVAGSMAQSEKVEYCGLPASSTVTPSAARHGERGVGAVWAKAGATGSRSREVRVATDSVRNMASPDGAHSTGIGPTAQARLRSVTASRPRYIAFLRAVNVGGRIVTMEELRAHFAAAGFSDVETFIASGNVLFSSPARSTEAAERAIEQHLQKALGYQVATFIRTPAEVAAAAAHEPFPAHDVAGAGAYVAAFLKRPLDAAGTQGLAALASPYDRFVTTGRVVYWLSTLKQSESKLSLVKFERAVGGPATMRAMTSLKKLAAKHCPTTSA